MERLVTLERAHADYDEDIAAWADAQVELLRAGRLDAVDLEHIIEEIESVGKSERSALSSQIGRIAEHLLKLLFSPAVDPRRGWVESIVNARREIDRLLRDSPSLRRELDAMVAEEVVGERRAAIRVLQLYGELNREIEDALAARTFTTAEVVGDWFPPDVALKT